MPRSTLTSSVLGFQLGMVFIMDYGGGFYRLTRKLLSVNKGFIDYSGL